jgi:probable HAF family extracellular repeat protein
LKQLKHTALIMLVASTALGAFAARADAGAPYVAIDLGTAYKDVSSQANAINDAGEIVGFGSAGSSSIHPIAWTQTAGMSAIGAGRPIESANAISPSGHIVGGMRFDPAASDPVHVFVWQNAADPSPVEIGTLGGHFSSAAGINDAEEVVGFSETSTPGQDHAFVWTPAGGMLDIGTLGGTMSNATAVNAAGEVVGYSTLASGAQHAFRWTPSGGMVDLGSLVAGGSSTAAAISDTGEIVGSAQASLTPGVWHAVSWAGPGGPPVDLGGAPSADWTGATAVNGSGQIVGEASTGVSSTSFSYTPASGIVLLPGLGGSTTAALGINASGTIVGMTTNGDGKEHATLWQPADSPPLAPARPFLDPDPGMNYGQAETTSYFRQFELASLIGTPGGLVTLYRGNVPIATQEVDPGAVRFEFSDTVPADGIYAYSETLTDGSGRVSLRSATLLLQVDTTGPELHVSGAPSGTYDVHAIPARPTFHPTDPDQVVDPRDTWVGPSTASGIGTYVYTATAQDAFGNESQEVRTYVVIDRASALAAPDASKGSSSKLAIGRPSGGMPHAGRLFTIAFSTARAGEAGALAAPKLTWVVRLGTRNVPHTSRFKGRAARLSLKVPPRTRGKRLTIRLTIRVNGAAATRLIIYRVR